MDEPLEDRYFRWLCSHVLNVEIPTPSLTYWNLLRLLHGTQYVWVQGYDENRAEDGVELRYYYRTESHTAKDDGWEHLPCSVLEFLVSLSARAEFNSMMTEPPAWWFWHFIDNLDINFPDNVELPEEYVIDVLDRWMYRQYEWTGQGGLFPLEVALDDQRNVETWYQLMAYLEEKGW